MEIECGFNEIECGFNEIESNTANCRMYLVTRGEQLRKREGETKTKLKKGADT